MKLYALIIEDRHTDVEVRLFASKDEAILQARKHLDDYAMWIGNTIPREYYNLPTIEEAMDQEQPWREQRDGTDGWWYHAMWSPGREDYLSVREVTVEDWTNEQQATD